MNRVLVWVLLLLCFGGCSAKRQWQDRNARLEFDMHYGRSGAVEVTQEEVQLYDDGVLMVNLRGRIESVTLDDDAYNELRHIFLDSDAIEVLKEESAKPLYEREHIHFNMLSDDGKMKYYYVYFEGMPSSITTYMNNIDAFIKRRFPSLYVPMKQLTDG